MKTIEINYDKILTSNQLHQIFNFKKIGKGDKLIFISEKPWDEFSKKLLIFTILGVLIPFFLKRKDEDHSGFDYPLQNESVDEIENAIESEFGIEIDYKSNEINAIDELFGLWKNREVSLEQIREDIWGRKN